MDLLVLMSKGKLDASLISGGSPVIGCLVVIAVVDAIVVVVGGVGGDFVVVFNVDRIVDVDLVGTVCSRRIDGVVPFGRTVVLTVGSVAAGKIQRNVSDIQRRQRANKKNVRGLRLVVVVGGVVIVATAGHVEEAGASDS